MTAPTSSAAEPLVRAVSACRICGSSSLSPVFALGDQYIAGVFLRGSDAAEASTEPFHRRYPLELVRCDPAEDPAACGLLQLRHSVSRNLLFAHYGYRSGINQTMRDNLRDIAAKAELMVHLRPGDTVLDIGCNDGTLLEAYETRGLDLIGIDPADDVTAYARGHGLEVLRSFFSASAYRSARGSKAPKVVTSIAMFYDLDDPKAFARDVASILAEDGVWVLELAWLASMLRLASFDSICHEHLEYYALAQLERVMTAADLVIHRAETNAINGGSIRLFVRPAAVGPAPVNEKAQLDEFRRTEADMRLDRDEAYRSFRERAERIRQQLVNFVDRANRDGKTVYAYGASTKGNVILQYCGLDRSRIVAAADRNPDKWGAMMMGTRIPIVSEELARAQRPDFFLVLPYHFIDEFVSREAEYLRQGGQFIVPIPEVRVIGSTA